MTSSAQLESNRRNAHFSTGPVTTAGKEKSSRNAFKHGLASRQIVLAHEDPADFEQLHSDLGADHRPAGATEEMLVFELAIAWWRLRRARSVEAEYLRVLAKHSSDQAIARQIADSGAGAIEVATAERSWRRALSQLQQTQVIRHKREREQSAPQPETGFVSQESAAGAVVTAGWREPDESGDRSAETAAFAPGSSILDMGVPSNGILPEGSRILTAHPPANS
jgi:hypothetical protein